MTIPEVLIVTRYLLKLRADYQESANIYCQKFNDSSLSTSQKESYQLLCETSRTVVTIIDSMNERLEIDGDQMECRQFIKWINFNIYSKIVGYNEANIGVNAKKLTAAKG